MLVGLGGKSTASVPFMKFILQGNLVANKLKRTQENSSLVSARIELIEIQPAFI